MIDNSGTLTPKWRWMIDRGTEQVWQESQDGELAAGHALRGGGAEPEMGDRSGLSG